MNHVTYEMSSISKYSLLIIQLIILMHDFYNLVVDISLLAQHKCRRTSYNIRVPSYDTAKEARGIHVLFMTVNVHKIWYKIDKQCINKIDKQCINIFQNAINILQFEKQCIWYTTTFYICILVGKGD